MKSVSLMYILVPFIRILFAAGLGMAVVKTSSCGLKKYFGVLSGSVENSPSKLPHNSLWGPIHSNIKTGREENYGFIQKRGLPAIDSSNQSSDEYETERQTLPVEEELLSLFRRTTEFKRRIARDPRFSNEEYLSLQQEVSAFIYDFYMMKSAGYLFSRLACTQMQQLIFIFEMIDMNLDLRSIGCGPQLDILGGKEINPAEIPEYTLIEKVLDDKEMISKALEEGRMAHSPQTPQKEKIDDIFVKFEQFENSCKLFTQHRTILSEIVSEELSIIRSQVAELRGCPYAKNELFSGKGTPLKSNSLHEDLKGPELKAEADVSNSQKFKEMMETLESAYKVEYADEETLDLEAYDVWRKSVSSACETVFFKLSASGLPEGQDKRAVEKMVLKIDEELSHKINSILFAVAADSSSMKVPTKEDLELTTEFNELLKGDRENTQQRIQLVVESLESLIDMVDNLDPVAAKDQIRIQRRVLERISKYLRDVRWSRLIQAREVIETEKKAFEKLENVEQLAEAIVGSLV